MRKVVFDIETSNQFSDVGSYTPEALDIAVVGVWDSENDTLSCYLEEDLPQLWPVIEKADLLIGYNSDHFDIPLLNKYYPGDLARIKSVDLLKEIKRSIGKRLKLDSVAEATLGINKSGHGLEALKWWREGRVEDVKRYCLDDVKITRDLYEYARAHQKLLYKDWNATREIPLNTSSWEKPRTDGMTHTLPL